MRDLNYFAAPDSLWCGGFGVAVSMRAGDAWSVLARARKAGHLDPIVRTLGDNTGAPG